MSTKALDMLVELKEELDLRKIELWLARVHGPVREILERSEFLEQIGQEKIMTRNLDSIVTYLSRVAQDELQEITIVSDGLKMTTNYIDLLLSQMSGEQRQVLGDYRQKLAEISNQLE